MQLDLLEFLVAHAACGVLAHGLEYADDIQIFAIKTAWQNGTAINVNGRHVGAQHAHHAARHVLVDATDDHHPIHPLTPHTGFDPSGDNFASQQRLHHENGRDE